MWLNDVIKAQACPSSACWHFVLRLQDGARDAGITSCLTAASKADYGPRGPFCTEPEAEFPLCLPGGNWVRRPPNHQRAWERAPRLDSPRCGVDLPASRGAGLSWSVRVPAGRPGKWRGRRPGRTRGLSGSVSSSPDQSGHPGLLPAGVLVTIPIKFTISSRRSRPDGRPRQNSPSGRAPVRPPSPPPCPPLSPPSFPPLPALSLSRAAA